MKLFTSIYTLGLTLLSFTTVCAQQNKFEVYIRQNDKYIVHKVAGEDLYAIAQLYNVPAVVLSQFNKLSFYDRLQEGQEILVPLDNYNFQSSQPSDTSAFRPVWYRNTGQENNKDIAARFRIAEEQLQVSPVDPLLSRVGWVMYAPPRKSAEQKEQDTPVLNKTQPATEHNASISPIKPDIASDTLNVAPNELIKIYRYQTSDEQYMDSVSGMVAFYKPQTALRNNLFYALSDEIPRGKVVKIVNPSNGRYIFAKVIGKLPLTKQYINAKLALDGHAREFLQTREIKLWCDFFFKY